MPYQGETRLRRGSLAAGIPANPLEAPPAKSTAASVKAAQRIQAQPSVLVDETQAGNTSNGF
jgi:hypothetical protein